MNIRAEVSALKQQLEQLFPGKWLSASNLHTSRQKVITTGVAEVDHNLINGIARQRITEWIGPVSSGKTTFLRKLIGNWCSIGLNVAYIDSQSRLLAADWILDVPGRFWVIRLDDQTKPNQNNYWAAEQIIRSNKFDVVILDLGSNSLRKNNHSIQSRIYARLQRTLDRSRTALLVLKDINNRASEVGASDPASNSWGCHSRFSFRWQKTNNHITSPSGIVAFLPTANLQMLKDGQSSSVEITPYKEGGFHVQNCLFTHPPIPDRRTPKA